MTLDAHVSTSGEVHLAPGRGAAIGATAVQVFTKSPNQWRDPAGPPAAREALAKSMSDHDIRGIIEHDPYLLNMASPDPHLNHKSRTAFERELSRCETLGIPDVVSHQGNYIDVRERGLKRYAEAYTITLRNVLRTVKVLIETTAGTATSLGSTFDELSILRSMIADDVRGCIGYRLDTCHVLRAGYNLRNR